MFERLLILVGLAVLVVLIWQLTVLWRAWRVRQLRETQPLASVVPVGQPAVVAFSTPTCAECRIRQAPALARLATMLGDRVTIRTLSALEHSSLVERIGVLTVPATVIVDAGGQVRHLNLGYAPETTLREQLSGVGGFAS